MTSVGLSPSKSIKFEVKVFKVVQRTK